MNSSLLKTLILAALLISPAASFAADPADTSIFNIKGDHQVTRDGTDAKTIVNSQTVTNASTGQSKSWSETEKITTTRSADGSSWTRQLDEQNSRGGKLDATTTGTSTRTAPGAGNGSSVTHGSATHPDGKTNTFEVDRRGSWSTSGNVRTFSSEADRSNSNGVTSERKTQGQSTKTATGKTWESTTTGSNSKGAQWTEKTDGSLVRKGNGVTDIDSTKTITDKTGRVETIKTDTVITKKSDSVTDIDTTKIITGKNGRTETIQKDSVVTHKPDGATETQTTETITGALGSGKHAHDRKITSDITRRPHGDGTGYSFDGTRTVSAQ